MNPVKIFIVDDEAPARQRLSDVLGDIQAECPHALIGSAEHAQQALSAIAELVPDIVLLDVQMPEMNGMELARHLRILPKPPAVIFVTAYDEFAVQAFELHALDYLLKPVRASRLAEALLRASKLHSAQADLPALPKLPVRRQHFSVLERGRILLVPVADILWMRAAQKYVELHTAQREYLIEESLISLESEFEDLFVRAHRNTLVARKAIAGVERNTSEGEQALEAWQIIVHGAQERLPISRRQWAVIKAILR